MNDFVKDTWQDLRERRLWPIAVVMLLAIVAIPTVLAKSATSPPPADTAAEVNVTARSSLALDTGSAASSGKGSSLDVFAPDDPFTPPRVSAAADDASAGVDAVAAGAGETVDVSIGGGGGTTDDKVDVEVEAPQPPQTKTETKTVSYEYVADISFWQGNRRRQIEGLRKLDMLPNESAPVLIFMGASADGGNATFLVDSTLKTFGEGRCRPSRSNCAFVDVGPGAEHVFTSEEGESYRLRVEEIRRVKVTSGASAHGSRAPARASVGEAPPTRRFMLPSLIDLVEVDTTETVTGATGSTNSAGGR